MTLQSDGARATATAMGSAAAASQDRTTLERCAAGDAGELETLYWRHAGACLAHARLVLMDERHAEAAVQEVFLDLWRHAGHFDESRTTVRGWLLMLTHHKAVDRVRTQRRRSTTVPVPEHPDPAGDRPRPDIEALLLMLSDDTRRALTELSAVQRQALVLAYCGGCTQTEIARLIGAPLGTVRTRMLAGMRELGPALARAGAAS